MVFTVGRRVDFVVGTSKTGVICKDKQDCFNDFTRKGYWSSSEHSAESAWYLNFVSGAIVANSKASNYATRPVAQF